MSRWLAAAFALVVVAAVAVIVGAPLLPVPVGATVYAAGSFLCHQLPERSFHLQSFQLPVCARCLGLYGGGALGSVAAAVSMAPLRRHRALTLVAALPTAATFVLEWGGGWRISNEVRAAAAVPLGLMVAFVVVSATATLHYDECTPPRPIAPAKPPAPSI